MMSTVPLVVSQDLFGSISTYFVRYLAQATFSGSATLLIGGAAQTISLYNPVIIFTPGGCVPTKGNCWYGGGILDLTGRDGTAYITHIEYIADTPVGSVGIGVDVKVEVAMGSIYRVETYLSAEIPQSGLVRVFLPAH
jgi:hypothetical protein